MQSIISPEHKELARKINTWLATYADVELLLKVGEYKKGTDPDADIAIAKYKPIVAFLQQGTNEFDSYETTLGKLRSLCK